jgi:light-regulated signal transduction histidine kinase (bacteriophytochrome)
VTAPLRETLDLAPIIREIEARLRARTPERHVEVAIEGPLTTSADRLLLEPALEQLLDMSWQTTRARPVAHVQVGSLVGPDGTAFYIRDDGLGGGDADDPDLAEVAAVVEAHGGRLWTESAPGAGTTIYFTLGR